MPLCRQLPRNHMRLRPVVPARRREHPGRPAFKGATYKCKVTVLGATASGYKYLMASIGVHALYDCAEYPFILYVNWANFAGTETNGYGEEIQRATVKGYATNSAGDFEDVYAVIIRCKCGLFQPHKRRFLHSKSLSTTQT